MPAKVIPNGLQASHELVSGVFHGPLQPMSHSLSREIPVGLMKVILHLSWHAV